MASEASDFRSEPVKRTVADQPSSHSPGVAVDLLRRASRGSPMRGRLRPVPDEDKDASADEPWSDEYMHGLFEEVHREAEIGRAVAALRPSRTALGESLVGLTNLIEMAIKQALVKGLIAELERRQAAGQEDADDVDDTSWVPAKDSPARREREELLAGGWDIEFQQRDWSRDFGRTLFMVRRLTEAAVDHLRAIGIILQDERPTLAAMALARISLEAAARVCHLLEPTLTADERITQTLNAEIVALQDSWKSARKTGDVEQEGQLDSEMQTLASYAKQRGQTKDSTQGRCLAPYVSASTMIDHALEHPPRGLIYHTLSTVVQSQEHEGLRIVLGLGEEEAPAQRTAHVAVNVLPSIVVITKAYRLIADYTGWVFDPDLGHTADLVLQQWAAGSGLADDYYRHQVEPGWERDEPGDASETL